MATFLRCDSREAEAWLISTFGDKGRTLLDEIHRIHADYGLELFVNTAVPVRTFTKDLAKHVDAVMTREAERLDLTLGRIPYGSKNATRKSTRIAKDLCLLALLLIGFEDEDGRPMSVNSFCEMLKWRRLDHRVFTSEAKVEQYDETIDGWTRSESRELLKHSYARIKKEIKIGL